MGKGYSRRDFLKHVCAGTCGAAIHNILSPASGMLAYAAPPTAATNLGERIMLVINFAGGMSYNVASFLGAFQDLMPTTGYRASGPANQLGIPLNSQQVLHPSLTALKTLWDEGDFKLLNMVGYPNANRSHDESTDIWQSGIRYGSSAAAGGWAARLTQAMGTAFAGISLSGSTLLVEGGNNPPIALENLNSLGEQGFWGGDYGTDWLRMTRSNMMFSAEASKNNNQAFVQNVNASVDGMLSQIATSTNINLPVTFPANSGISDRLRDAAKIIASPINAKFIFVEFGGFDTHSNEKATLTSRMTEFNAAIGAFANCMKALGRWQDVIILTMSEFSRTFENGSQGTDHGHAAPLLVLGGSVNGGSATPAPSDQAILTAKSKYDYFHGYDIDFRQVYKEAVIAMGYDANLIFPEAIPNATYTNLNLFS
jgi:uncharacterized protein (DUF1501 family)